MTGIMGEVICSHVVGVVNMNKYLTYHTLFRASYTYINVFNVVDVRPGDRT